MNVIITEIIPLAPKNALANAPAPFGTLQIINTERRRQIILERV